MARVVLAVTFTYPKLLKRVEDERLFKESGHMQLDWFSLPLLLESFFGTIL